jgi:hypothetical protein
MLQNAFSVFCGNSTTQSTPKTQLLYKLQNIITHTVFANNCK